MRLIVGVVLPAIFAFYFVMLALTSVQYGQRGTAATSGILQAEAGGGNGGVARHSYLSRIREPGDV